MPNNQECFDAFIEEMRIVLKSHNSIKGNDWRNLPDYVLVDNLFQEIGEFERKNDPDYELIDIANSCYLLWAKRKFFRGI